MFKSLFVLSLLFFAQTSEPLILSPQAGATLRGQVEIVGILNVPNFSSAELAFSYASNPADVLSGGQGWFTIQKFSQIPETQALATWDTTLLTDGEYDLYLRVFLQDGSSQDAVVSGLKIRNDEIPLTDTPTPANVSSPLTMTATPSPTAESITATPVFFTPTPVFPTPTSLPPNPASVTSASIFYYFARGGLIAIVVISFFALILRLRKN